MFTTIVTIGRNVGSVPMSDIAWFTFTDHVADNLAWALSIEISAGYEGGQLSRFDGQSFWQGVAEHSATFQLIRETRFDPSDYEILRNNLKDLAREYRQDCIAIIPEAQADLVPASTEGPVGIPAGHPSNCEGGDCQGECGI